MEKDKPKESLVTKLARIMGKVDRVPKNGRNEFFGYDYATEADITDHIRKLLAEEKIVLIPNIIGSCQLPKKDKEGNERNDITQITVEFNLYDGDSDEKIQFHIIGHGEDKGDKGPYKALTGAVKYALMKSFLIPTGDDPENDGNGKKAPSPEPKKAEPEKQSPPPKEPANPKTVSLIKEVEVFNGKTEKGPYTRFKIIDHAGREFSTFDTKIGGMATREKDTYQKMVIEYRPREWQNKKGEKMISNDIVSMGPEDIPQ